jgi:hypothetical protein
MVSEQDYMRHEILEIVLYLTVGLIAVILIPNFIGFFLKGFAESFVPGKSLNFGDILVNYQIYTFLLIGAFLAVLFPIVKILTIKKNIQQLKRIQMGGDYLAIVIYLTQRTELFILYLEN